MARQGLLRADDPGSSLRKFTRSVTHPLPLLRSLFHERHPYVAAYQAHLGAFS